jgi:DNA-binding SARP family transcriptional activator/TolB-like protein
MPARLPDTFDRANKITDLAAVRRTKVPAGDSGESQKMARIYLLGPMRAVAPGGEDILPRGRKTRALFAYLCLAQGERVSRSRLVGLLWDRSEDAHARMSLRQALSELNAVVNTQGHALVEIDREGVRVNIGACWIDALAAPDRIGGLLEDLEGVSPPFDHWLAAERTRLEDSVRASLEDELARLVEEHAAPELQAAAARRLINFDPTHEAAARTLMTAFVRMGDRAQAIREFERCRDALRAVLDLAPSKETTALYEAVRLVSSGDVTGPAGRVRDRAGAPKAPAEFEDGDDQPPSIAVLPFRSQSLETGRDYAAEGLVEDLIETLSRIPNFFVISRLSTLSFRNQDRPPREIGEVLGVRYVISGSMRLVGNHLRLNVELTDTRKGTALWSSRLDERCVDLLEVQDRLADGIARRVAPYLRAAEIKRARTKPPEHLEAYDLFLQAQENMHNSSRAVFESSERLFDEALARDPNYATALAWRAYWHVLRVGQGWSPDPARDAAQAESFARRAVDANRMEPMAFAVQGHIASYLNKDFGLAFQHFETALRINPNAAPAWLWSAAANAWTGNGPRAVEEINRAMALSPYDPLMYAYNGIAGVAYLEDGQYERAVEFHLRAIRENGTYTSSYRALVVSLMLARREDEARSAVYQLLKLEPDLTVERWRARYPGRAGPRAALYCDALARAGVPLSG